MFTGSKDPDHYSRSSGQNVPIEELANGRNLESQHLQCATKQISEAQRTVSGTAPALFHGPALFRGASVPFFLACQYRCTSWKSLSYRTRSSWAKCSAKSEGV